MKIIWIDVGTHFAQEHSSIFGSNYSFYSFILKRFLSGKILKRGKFISFKELKSVFHSRTRIRKRSSDFYSVFVEANPRVAYKNFFYPDADMFFNIALTNASRKPISIVKLYLGNETNAFQGSSLFLEKNNLHKDSFIETFGVSTGDFFSELELHLNDKFSDYRVLLRLNCEGVEDDVIYSSYKIFGNKLKLICGALKDVEEIKGKNALQKLEEFISYNNIAFKEFNSNVTSWPKAHLAILNLLEKTDDN
mgnify:FL=1